MFIENSYLRLLIYLSFMKKNSLLLFILVIGMYACQEPKEKAFERVAREMTEKCPIAFSEYIRLDSVIYLPSKNVNRYYYTLMGERDNIQALDGQEENLKNEVRNSVELKEYKDFNTTIAYTYYSESSGSELMTITIKPEDYK